MKYWKCSILLLLVILIAGVQAQDQKFNVYGFMDINFSKNLTMADNTMLRGGSYGEQEPEISIGNLNVYLDFNPNRNSRILVELALLKSLADKSPVFDTKIDDATTNPLPVELQAQLNGMFEKEAEDEIAYGGISVYRAWTDYMVNDLVNIRAGKFVTPAGIWNVDHGTPVLPTISQPSQTSFLPLFPETQVGAMLYGLHFLGDYDLAYNVYLSKGRFDEGGNPRLQDRNNPEKLSDLGYGGHASISGENLAEFTFGTSVYTGAVRNMNTVVKIKGVVPGPNVVTDIANGENTYYTDVETQSLRELVVGADVKLHWKGVTVQAELNRRQLTDDETDEEIVFLGWYGMVSYKKSLSGDMYVTPYFFYEDLNWDAGGIAQYPTNVLPISAFFTTTAGVKLGLLSNLSLKLEYSSFGLTPNNEPSLGAISLANSYTDSDFDFSIFRAQLAVAF
ncbi:MAG: hypothetical protein OCC49_18675 [Fibrobacterales bacterium]